MPQTDYFLPPLLLPLVQNTWGINFTPEPVSPHPSTLFLPGGQGNFFRVDISSHHLLLKALYLVSRFSGREPLWWPHHLLQPPIPPIPHPPRSMLQPQEPPPHALPLFLPTCLFFFWLGWIFVPAGASHCRGFSRHRVQVLGHAGFSS